MLNLRLASLQLAVVFLVRRKQCFPAFPQIFPAFSSHVFLYLLRRYDFVGKTFFTFPP